MERPEEQTAHISSMNRRTLETVLFPRLLLDRRASPALLHLALQHVELDYRQAMSVMENPALATADRWAVMRRFGTHADALQHVPTSKLLEMRDSYYGHRKSYTQVAAELKVRAAEEFVTDDDFQTSLLELQQEPNGLRLAGGNEGKFRFRLLRGLLRNSNLTEVQWRQMVAWNDTDPLVPYGSPYNMEGFRSMVASFPNLLLQVAQVNPGLGDDDFRELLQDGVLAEDALQNPDCPVALVEELMPVQTASFRAKALELFDELSSESVVACSADRATAPQALDHPNCPIDVLVDEWRTEGRLQTRAAAVLLRRQDRPEGVREEILNMFPPRWLAASPSWTAFISES